MSTGAEPVELAKFFKDRLRSDVVKIEIRDLGRSKYLDIREYYTDALGRLQPSRRGVTIGTKLIPKLEKAIALAIRHTTEVPTK